MPRRRKGHDALDRRDCGRAERHRPSEAIADQRRRTVQPSKQGHEQSFDMAGNVQFRSIPGRTPIEQEDAPAHRAHCSSERDILVEVEHGRRVDQRRNEDHGRTGAAMIDQPGRAGRRQRRTIVAGGGAWRRLVERQAAKRRPCQLRRMAAKFADEVEKKGKGTRAALMLQCRRILL